MPLIGLLAPIVAFVERLVNRRQGGERRVSGSVENADVVHAERRLRELDRRALTGDPIPDISPEKFEVDRTVANWLLNGRPSADSPEVQRWLRQNGYGHLLVELPEQ